MTPATASAAPTASAVEDARQAEVPDDRIGRLGRHRPDLEPEMGEDDGERVDRRDADRADGDTHHDPDQDRERAEAQEQDEPAMRTSPHAHT